MNRGLVRYKRIADRRYIAVVGEDRIGMIERMNDRRWHATNPSMPDRRVHTRNEEADLPVRSGRENLSKTSIAWSVRII
jgi:hypothetical protein